MNLPFKVQYIEDFNLRDLQISDCFKTYLDAGLYSKKGPKEGNVNLKWGIYNQLTATFDNNKFNMPASRNEFIEDVFYSENRFPHCIESLNFRHMRFLCQDTIKRGNIKPIPIKIVSKKFLEKKNFKVTIQDDKSCVVENSKSSELWHRSNDGEYFVTIHPGNNIANACFFTSTPVQVLIFSSNEDEINFAGDDINYDTFQDIFLYGKDYKKFKSSPYKTVVSKASIENFKKSDLEVDEFGILSGIGRLFKDGHWLFGDSNTYDFFEYGSIFRNSFPMNVYIGTESESEFNQYCDKITEVRKKIFKYSNILSERETDLFYDEKEFFSKCTDYLYKLYHEEIFTLDVRKRAKLVMGTLANFLPCETKSANINFIRISPSDYKNVPQYNNYKGFCVYLNSKTDYNRDIFDLFYLGNSKSAKSHLNNDLILYNCEHPIWKYNVECYESDTIKISSEFCKSIVGD